MTLDFLPGASVHWPASSRLRAAEGQANPEIASRLFPSPRTVEYHLGQVFIGSRTIPDDWCPVLATMQIQPRSPGLKMGRAELLNGMARRMAMAPPGLLPAGCYVACTSRPVSTRGERVDRE